MFQFQYDCFYTQSKNLLHNFCSPAYPEEPAMTLRDFTLLNDKEKISLLYVHGVYVGKRKIGKTTTILYQLEGFYAEVFYRSYRRYVERICCFEETTRLDPYLTEIHVEHLV